MTSSLQFSDVQMTYQSGLNVLRGLSFFLRSGEIAILTGENGAGKTTVLDIACGNVEPTGGSVWVHGTRATGRSPQAIARLGARRMYQSPASCRSLSIMDNVLLAYQPSLYARFLPMPLNSTRRDLWKKVRKSAAPLFDMCTFLSRELTPAGELSFGERRIVDFVGVVAGAEPKSILLLDEPFAGIHEDVAEAMRSLIARLSKLGATVLMIEHKCEYSDDAKVRQLRLVEGVVQ